MKEKILIDLEAARKGNYFTVHEALSDLQKRLTQNSDKEVVDVCGDLLLYYKDRMDNINCETKRVRYALKHNVIQRYLKE
ncbi:MAG: hypothetical protein CMP47_12335 [Rickettsiales bacterium]|nr:hypothetical protein [Rickettsiales bacterium]|tara:strand:+ start:879 stop:1118 length:240 start_codon:yes stop_codon:yes gene_type:complete